MYTFFKKPAFLLLLTFALFSAKAWGQVVPLADHLFHPAEARKAMDNRDIDEASGLVASINNPNMLWAHNDSGDKARIFLLNEQGEFKAEFTLLGVENRDWEDIAIGPGPDPAKNYLYVGEIGDNRAVYDKKYIYRFEEPRLQDADKKIRNVEIITYVYPDGKRDAESLFVDPLTKDIYVLSKRENNIGIYRAAYPQSTTATITLEKLGTMPFLYTVAADITPDGQEILTKTYNAIYYWKRKAGATIAETLMSPAVQIPYLVEPQGESIAWKRDGSGFFTLSEEANKVQPVLYFYRRKK
jgi:hypothetical protein